MAKKLKRSLDHRATRRSLEARALTRLRHKVKASATRYKRPSAKQYARRRSRAADQAFQKLDDYLRPRLRYSVRMYDAIDYIMKVHGKTYPAAVEQLAGWLGCANQLADHLGFD